MEITENLFKGRNMTTKLATVDECKKEIVEVMSKIINYGKKFNNEQEYILKNHRDELEEYLTKNLNFEKSEERKYTNSYKYRNKKYFDLDIYLENMKNGIVSFSILLKVNGGIEKYVKGCYQNVNIPDMEGARDVYGVKECSSKNRSDDDIWHYETDNFDIDEWNRYVEMIQDIYYEDIQTRMDEGMILYVDSIQQRNKKYKCDKTYKNLLEVFKDCVIDN